MQLLIALCHCYRCKIRHPVQFRSSFCNLTRNVSLGTLLKHQHFTVEIWQVTFSKVTSQSQDFGQPGSFQAMQLTWNPVAVQPSVVHRRHFPMHFGWIFLQKHQLGFIFILDYTTEVEQFTPEFGKELFSGYVKPRGVVDQVAMLLRTISHSTLPDPGWHELFVAGTHDWIETVNGDTLPAIFQKRVFDPAGMSPKDTYCDLTHLVCRPMFLLDRNMFWETYDFSKPPFKKNPLTRRILGREAFGSSTFGHLLLGKIADHWLKKTAFCRFFCSSVAIDCCARRWVVMSHGFDVQLQTPNHVLGSQAAGGIVSTARHLGKVHGCVG